MLSSRYEASVRAAIGSVLVDVDVDVVVVSGPSTSETCVPASLHSGTVYSVAGLDVDRTLASVGVCTSAMISSRGVLLTREITTKANIIGTTLRPVWQGDDEGQ